MTAGPYVGLAALVLGILAGGHAGGATAAVALVVGAGGIAAAAFVPGGSRLLVGALALAALGAAVSARASEGLASSPLSAATDARATVTVHGVLTSDPSGSRFVTSVLVRADANRTLLASAGGSDATRLRVLEAGDRVSLTGRLAPLRADGFDERAHWRHAVARLDDAQLLALGPPHGLLAIADAIRGEVLRGTASLAPTQRALLSGFLLGDTRNIPPDVTDAYRASGLSHLLAVSGENVAFVLVLFAPLLRRISLGARTALALGIVLVFAAMTRFEPSVLRASVMAAIALLATFAGRPAASGRVLAYAVIVLLVVDPFLLHSVGFWLSCGASAGIAFCEPAIARRLPGPRAVREPLAVSLAAQIGVMPVLLLAFGSFPVVTPLTNVVAAPAAEVLGVYGFIASAIAGAVPRLGPLVQQPSGVLVGWVTMVARAGSAVPLSLDGRGALACVAIGGAVASVACRRGRRAVPDSAPR